MTRDEFKVYAIDKLGKRFVNSINFETDPFWIPEATTKEKSHYFRICNKITVGRESWTDYTNWCAKNLSQGPKCFYSDDENNEEWWGFGNEQDALLWSIRWL